jgi:LiaI-LiaF-like transmembrane region
MQSKPGAAEGRKTTFQEHPHGLVGPVILIAVGAVFLVGQFVPAWRIEKTWPVLLIAIGIGKLVEIFFPRRSRTSDRSAAIPSREGKSL